MSVKIIDNKYCRDQWLKGKTMGMCANGLTWGKHRDLQITLCIYFQVSFHSAGGSSVTSGGALGSMKSGCCSSFRYFGGVRMWVEPTGDTSLKAQQGLNIE